MQVGQDVAVCSGQDRFVCGQQPAPNEEDRVVPGFLRSDCLSSLLYGWDGSDPGSVTPNYINDCLFDMVSLSVPA
jgi:hypothetical protein